MIAAWRGFYCIICSTEGIDAISYRNYDLFLRFYSNRIYYKWEFCEYLLAHAFPHAYNFYYNYFWYFWAVISAS